MISAAINHQDSMPIAARLASRGDLTAFLMGITADIGADAYMLTAILHDQDRSTARIVASNWTHDAIQLVGHGVIAALVQGPLTAAPGNRPQRLLTGHAPAPDDGIGGEEAKLLEVLGHGEICSLKLNVGHQRLFVLFSSATPASIDLDRLAQAQISCCYALSHAPDLLAAATMSDPLSDRERECLFWVSEGKTTDDVAVILGVSANTVNSYITHAIRKFSASNRAMAIATAIRSGII